ncbi:MAG: hypothetical protein EOO82_01885 [Oxalobacteraceae bacterium]|nr:MAG: hypothetical protein EOO82_01885 [Oxalobacteraceae bacterium]
MPRSEVNILSQPSSGTHDLNFVGTVLSRWRSATTHKDAQVSEPPAERAKPRTIESPLLQPSLGLDPDRFSLLKRPLR